MRIHKDLGKTPVVLRESDCTDTRPRHYATEDVMRVGLL